MQRNFCPFCGSIDTTMLGPHVGIYSATCCQCDALGPRAESETEAWNKWNGRINEISEPVPTTIPAPPMSDVEPEWNYRY